MLMGYIDGDMGNIFYIQCCYSVKYSFNFQNYKDKTSLYPVYKLSLKLEHCCSQNDIFGGLLMLNPKVEKYDKVL